MLEKYLAKKSQKVNKRWNSENIKKKLKNKLKKVKNFAYVCPII